MRSALHGLVLTALLLGGAGASRAASDVRLRPMAPIYVDANGVGLSGPSGISCRGTGQLVVADSGNGRLVVYSVDEQSIRPTAEINPTELTYPIRVRSRSDGEIIVLDGRTRRILRIEPSGKFLGYVEPEGASGTIVPRSLEVDRKDQLYILDVFSERILVVTAAGALRRQIAFPERYGFFSDLTVADGGTVYAIDSVGRRVYSAGVDDESLEPLSESLAEHLGFPASIAIDRRGHLFVSDQNGGGIGILGGDGTFHEQQSGMGWLRGRLRYPSDLCIDDADHLYVADRANNRIQAFELVE